MCRLILCSNSIFNHPHVKASSRPILITHGCGGLIPRKADLLLQPIYRPALASNRGVHPPIHYKVNMNMIAKLQGLRGSRGMKDLTVVHIYCESYPFAARYNA